jgi:hypothetical protein
MIPSREQFIPLTGKSAVLSRKSEIACYKLTASLLKQYEPG